MSHLIVTLAVIGMLSLPLWPQASTTAPTPSPPLQQLVDGNTGKRSEPMTMQECQAAMKAKDNGIKAKTANEYINQMVRWQCEDVK